jgi:hypothetical protein
MVKSVYVPEAGGIIDFADDVTPTQISGYINAKYPRAAAPAAAAQTSDDSGIFGRFAYGLSTGLTDIPGGIAALGLPAEKAAQTGAGQFSQEARKYLESTFGIDPSKDPTTAQMLAQGLGSAAGFLVPGGAVAKGAAMVGKSAALAGTVTAAGQGVALGAESRAEQIRQQLASGMEISEAKQLAAQRLDGFIGASEALPMGKFFGPLTKILSKVPASKAPIVEKILSNRLSRLASAGIQEGAQEAASGIASDLMEYGVYNPDVEIGQDILSNAGTGAFAGSTIEGVIQLALGRKVRGARQLQADLQTEAQKNSEDLRKISVTEAANSLAQSGVQGNVTIEPNETPEGSTVYTLTGADKKTITEFPTEDDAVQAVDLYKKMTGAAINVDVSAPPKLSAIRIGNQKFPTLAAAAERHRKIKDRVNELVRFGNNVDLVSKVATQEGVPPQIKAKQIADEIAAAKRTLAMFDRYFSPEVPEAKTKEEIKVGPKVSGAPVNSQEMPPEQPTPDTVVEAAPEPEVVEEPTVEAYQPEEDYTEDFDAPEPITDENIPDAPIGAVEMPVEESRILPDSIVEEDAAIAAAAEPVPEAPVVTEKRPAATAEDLMMLREEMFGRRIGWHDMTPEQRSVYEVERDKRFPPEDVEVYKSAGRLREPAPRNLREARMVGPTVKDYSPETKAWLKNVYGQLENRLEAIIPGKARIEFKTLVGANPDYLIRGHARAEETPNGIKSIVDLATGTLRPDMTVEQAVKELVGTLNHEMIHVLRDQGVIRPEEWRMLSRAATKTNIPNKKYTYLDKAEAVYTPDGKPMSPVYNDPDAVVEEAVAEMYREWVLNGQKPPQQAVGIFNRITEFLRRIFQVLRNARHDEIFKQIESGEIGQREGTGRTAETRYQAGPVGNMAGYQDENGVNVMPFPDVNTGSSTAYLRENFDKFKAKGRFTDPQWGRALDKAFADKFGRTYDINDPQDYQHIVASIADEVKLQMKQSQSGVGWYDSDIQDVFGELSKSFPILGDPDDGPAFRQMFTLIAGVMSNGMKAKANVELAAINFAHFLTTGRFSSVHPFTKTGWNQRSNIMGPQITMLNKMIEDPGFAPRPGSNNPRVERVENFLSFMFSEHSVREINAFRAKHGTKSPAKIGKLDDRRLGMYAFGPKFGPFILNLNGFSDETVDSWASRSFYRNMGTGIGPDGELIKGPHGKDREAMKRALRDVALAANLSSRDVQAVLWFYEKELYNHLGQKIPLEVFSDGAREFNRKYGTGTAGLAQPRTDREGEISRSIKAAGTRTGQTAAGVRFSAAPLVGSKEFDLWFGGSKVRNPDGSPKVFYHGTKTKFKAFDTKSSELGSHFGTPKQAAEFVKQDPAVFSDKELGEDYTVEGRTDQIFPVYLRLKNPLRMIDGGAWGANRTARQLVRMGIMTEPEYEKGKVAGNVTEGIKYVQDFLKQKGYDGIVYLNRREGLNEPPRTEDFDLDDQMFKFTRPEAEDSYIIFDPQQAKSTFNQFREGASLEARFSAAPLPPYVQQQNSGLFAPAVNVSTKDRIFNHFSGRRWGGKTLSTMHGQIEISGSTMAGIAGKEAVADKNAYITELEKLLNEKLTGNYQRMEANYSATAALAWRRRSSHIFASMLLRGNVEINFDRPGDIQSATIKVVDDTDSLKEIFNVITAKGPTDANGVQTDKSDIFRSYAVARRGEWLRASGQSVPAQLTPQYVREVTDFTVREYPEVVEAYNKYQRFNKKLLTTAKDAGIISQVELGRLTNQMNYYGFIYEAYGEPLGPTSSQKTASKFKLRPYTGTQVGGLTSDPMFVMMQNAQFWVDSIAKNIAATKAFELTRVMDESRLLGTDEAPNELRGEAPDVMFFSQNGVVKRFAVKDPSLVVALGSDDRLNVGKFWEMLGLPTYVLRESVTRDPGFMARNLLRDTVSAWVTSGADFTPVIDTIKGGITALKDGASYRALGSYGVVGSYDLAMLGPAELAAVLRRNSMPLNVHSVTTKEGAVAALGSLWNRLGHISEASDAATRIAVYDAAKKQGLSDAEAAMQAIELLDFTRRGGSQTLGILTKLIPFLNARIQGMDVLYQAGRSGIRYAMGKSLGERDANVGKRFLLRGGMLAVIATALEALNQGDDDYEQLDDYIKTGNLIVPLKQFGLEGQFLAIPKAFEVGLLFNTIPQQIYKTTTGEASGRENAELFWGSLQSTFGVNPIPQAILPAIEILTNHSFYTGLPLISEGKLRLDPSLQYNTSTSQIAMMLGGIPIFYDMTTGKFGGMSPIVIDKLISGYGGPLGTYLVQATSLTMENASIGPDRMPTEISNLPVIRSFFIDAKSKNPKVVTQAYELFRIADEANRTMSRLRQMGDAEALANYVDQNRDILSRKKYIFTLADRLNKLSAQERSIERDTTMSRDEKLAAQQKLREIRIRLSSQVDQINKTLGR